MTQAYECSGIVYDLFQNNTISDAIKILEENGIKVKKDTETEKYLLIYSTISCSNSNPYGQKCRGLIVNSEGMTVGRKYDRFFNFGEMIDITGQVDFSRAKYYPKEDGSLIAFWFDRDLNKWRISTKGTIDGKGPVKTVGGPPYQLFDELVYETLGSNEKAFQLQMDIVANAFQYDIRDFSFVFELCTKQNKVITDYQEDKMILLNIFLNHPDEYPIDQEYFDQLADYLGKTFKNVEPVKEITGINTKEEALEYCKSLNGLKEGLVVYDPVNGIRLKMKSPRYVWVANIKGEDEAPSLSKLAQIPYTGEIEEFSAYFPEWAQSLRYIKEVVDFRFQALEAIYKGMCVSSEDTSREAMAQFAKDLRERVPNAFYQKLFFMAKRQNKTLLTVFKEADVKFYVGFFEEAHKEIQASIPK